MLLNLMLCRIIRNLHTRKASDMAAQMSEVRGVCVCLCVCECVCSIVILDYKVGKKKIFTAIQIIQIILIRQSS
jgi:hypothetical protein